MIVLFETLGALVTLVLIVYILAKHGDMGSGVDIYNRNNWRVPDNRSPPTWTTITTYRKPSKKNRNKRRKK